MNATHDVELSAGTISYRDSGPGAASEAGGPSGSGAPIVFVHGLLVNGLLWRKVAPLLEDAGRVIVPDWPLGSHTRPASSSAWASSCSPTATRSRTSRRPRSSP